MTRRILRPHRFDIHFILMNVSHRCSKCITNQLRISISVYFGHTFPGHKHEAGKLNLEPPNLATIAKWTQADVLWVFRKARIEHAFGCSSSCSCRLLIIATRQQLLLVRPFATVVPLLWPHLPD
jgi:hypothetical protein